MAEVTSRYQPARDAFNALTSALNNDADLKSDVERTFDNLLRRYNTQIYENRFVVGSIAERIIAAAFVAMGQVAKTHGVRVSRTDLAVGNVPLSVKGSFRPKTYHIRLVNVMGESKAAVWDEPTIFVISQKGLGYADPELVPDATKRSRDAIQLRLRPLYQMWRERPEYFIQLEVPYSREDINGSDIASRVIADELLRYCTRLRPFDKRTPEE